MKWWVRIQLGQALLGQLITVIMLSANIAPTVGRVLGCSSMLAAILMPLVVGLTLVLTGWAMDAWGWVKRHDAQARDRSACWPEVFERLQRIEDKIKSE